MRMFRSFIDHHKKRFKRNPIVITSMLIWFSLYLYRMKYDDFIFETVVCYFLAFYFVPAFFNREGYERAGDLPSNDRCDSFDHDRTRSISRHHESSLSSRYDHNRNSTSSSLHNSSLGKGFL